MWWSFVDVSEGISKVSFGILLVLCIIGGIVGSLYLDR